VARFLVNLAGRALAGGWVEPAVVNGQGAAILRNDAGAPVVVVEVEVVAGLASRLHLVVNPDKLAHLDDGPPDWV
jgi:hypothetical protein